MKNYIKILFGILFIIIIISCGKPISDSEKQILKCADQVWVLVDELAEIAEDNSELKISDKQKNELFIKFMENNPCNPTYWENENNYNKKN